MMNNETLKDLKEQREEIISKWEASGVLDGLKQKKENVADIFECSATWIMNKEDLEVGDVGK